MEALSWGILGTGSIARTFARALQATDAGYLAAVASRSQASADAFGDEFGAERCYSSYDLLLADERVQAVYIATPHPTHATWAIRAAEAGKHILCEKPIGLNHAEAMTIVEAARRHGVFLMEAYMYRHHPQIARLVELIHSGAIGEVRAIQAAFSFDSAPNLEGRLLNQALGGGGILDVGGYPVSLARLVAGAARGLPFAEPTEVVALGHIGKESRVDEWSAAILRFPGDVIAQVATGVQLHMERGARIYGSAGSIYLPEPYLPATDQPARIVLERNGAPPEEIAVGPVDNYALEAEAAARHQRDGQAPQQPWDDTLGTMHTLDRWRAGLGLVYDSERPDAPEQRLPIGGRPLVVRPDAPMIYGRLPGLDKPVSRLVMGVDNQTTMPHAAAMFDDFFAQGGTCFDTAWVYSGGVCERMLGHWVKNRGLREQVVILGKGAHTPFCDPEHLTLQLHESLARLQTDYLDIYMLHRDNPAIPVEAFIDELNAHGRAGRIRVFGASNWSIARFAAANAYAAASGQQGFTALSNNFSLARMVEPVWAGCIAASDPASRAWLHETQTALFPWSSQARGFFTGRAHPDDRSDPELVRSWYSEDNFQRLERVRQLAQERDAAPIAVALAYVLSQPFPTFPLIGPRTLAETRGSLGALAVRLSPEEVCWLNLEA
ncbi:MAG TPA: aldo/keto reductase [Roseiflexaceae bacterium]|nr:aldo/keto reductase [Roseiflexaceae bacterium]